MYQKQPQFTDVYYQPGEEPVFCYRSGMLVYEEKFYQGTFLAQGYNAGGYPLNVLSNCNTRLDPSCFREPFAFNLEINGRSLDYDLRFVDFKQEAEGTGIHAVVTLESLQLPVRVQVHTLLDGTQMFTRYITVKNLSDQPQTISRMAVLSGGLENMDMIHRTYDLDLGAYYSVGYFDNDRWGREGEFNWHDLKPGTIDVDFRFNRGRYRHPLVFIRNNIDGTVFFSQIAWSGGCRYTVDYNAVPESRYKDFSVPALSFKAEILGHNPILVLAPGEVYTSAEVHMGAVQGDLDDAVNEMHDHIRRSVLNVPEADPSQCLITCGVGAEHDMTVPPCKKFVDQFAEMGGEIFILDAGWQNRPGEEMKWHDYNGLNVPDADRYPNGMKELSDYCHEKGLKFALWVEIERLGVATGLLESHPDWWLPNLYGEKSRAHKKYLLDFTNPEAAQWAEEELARIIKEYELDMLRVDYNVRADDYFNLKDIGGFGIKECVSIRHFQAVYAMYGRLKKRFPHILFENCASGGGRTDLGLMKAFNHTWVTDWQKMPHAVMITNGMTMALPPERVDRLFAGMGSHNFGCFDAHMRNTMLGHMTLNVIAPPTTMPNPVQMEFVKHSVELYKNFIRPMLPTCKMYHHTPETYKAAEDGYMVLEVGAQDKKRGAMTVFTLGGAGAKAVTVWPKGLDLSVDYWVTMDNRREKFQMSGRELTMEGLRVEIPTSLASELVLFEAVE